MKRRFSTQFAPLVVGTLRVVVSVLLAVGVGQINNQLAREVPADPAALKVVTGVALAMVLYVILIKPLVAFANEQHEAKLRKSKK
jgi:hypothetical protein